MTSPAWAPRVNETSLTYFIFLRFSNHWDMQILLFSLLFLLYLLTLVGNSLILLITMVDLALHTPMYFFIRNLSFLGICYTSVTVPKLLANLISEDRSVSFVSCAVQLYFLLFFGTVECFLLASMSDDRYLAICYPLHYTAKMTKGVYIGLSLVCWLCGIFIPLGNTAGIFSLLFCGPNQIDCFFCDFTPVLKLACVNISPNEVVTLASSLLITVLPLLFTAGSYLCIIYTILKIPLAEGRHKAFSTCSSHFIVVTLFYCSPSFVYLQPKSSYSPEWEEFLSLFHTVITPMLNPIIYSLRNKEVKEALRRTLKRLLFS
ncbi:olfactory receptor 10A7-like [Chelonoidis abingdonii]|uniref:olfactory receptor 10A7-like n=1 Tax=Chelonoidis abingdonii TaxID=106734 RepID=UPI0013F1EAD6|nr:olfactory receptor 10A7-like [Chelonoidis abingdonii]